MGNCNSNAKADKDRNDAIDMQLRKDKQVMDNEVKLLLLGAGESGKSTIVKQMKIIHKSGYSEEECESFKGVIFSNTIQSMKVIVAAMGNLGIDFEEGSNKDIAEQLADIPISADAFDQKVGEWIKTLWKDAGVLEAFNRRAEFQLNDSAQYYFDSIDRLTAADYVPTQQDVLRSRVRTTGIVETEFEFGGLLFKMFDVGGQRNERKKWIHCFQDVTAVIFVVGISEYDQKLSEDETQNRMKESLLLFDEICNLPWFVNVSMILFLNKTDLFAEKIKKVDLTICFPDYDGGNDYDKATEYITEAFTSLNKSSSRQVYPYLTCATDTNTVKRVFTAVKDIILQNNLKLNGFMS